MTTYTGVVAWRWRPKDSSTWIYNPEPEWLAQQNGDEIDKEPLYAASPAVAPQGWKLVPVEPTEEMQLAAKDSTPVEPRCPDFRATARSIYACMLAAAPRYEPFCWRWKNFQGQDVYTPFKPQLDANAVTLYASPQGRPLAELIAMLVERWHKSADRYVRSGSDWHMRMPADWPMELALPVGLIREIARIFPDGDQWLRQTDAKAEGR